jgi:hypothetical protein
VKEARVAEPDFVLSPKDGEASRVTVIPRATPWLIRIAQHDLYVVIAGDAEEPVEDPVVAPEAAIPDDLP